MNLLSPVENMTPMTHSIKPNGARIEMEIWTGVDTWRRAEAV